MRPVQIYLLLLTALFCALISCNSDQPDEPQGQPATNDDDSDDQIEAELPENCQVYVDSICQRCGEAECQEAKERVQQCLTEHDGRYATHCCSMLNPIRNCDNYDHIEGVDDCPADSYCSYPNKCNEISSGNPKSARECDLETMEGCETSLNEYAQIERYWYSEDENEEFCECHIKCKSPDKNTGNQGEPCNSENDCRNWLICDGVCVECRGDYHCFSDQICQNSRCVDGPNACKVECWDDYTCGADEVCRNNCCIDNPTENCDFQPEAKCYEFLCCYSGCEESDKTCINGCQDFFVGVSCFDCMGAFNDCLSGYDCIEGEKVDVYCASQFCAELYERCYGEKLPAVENCSGKQLCQSFSDKTYGWCKPEGFESLDDELPGADGEIGGLCNENIECSDEALCVSDDSHESGICATLCPNPG